MQCFVVLSEEVRGNRIDPNFVYYSRNQKLSGEAGSKILLLGSLLKEKPTYGAGEVAVDGNPKTDYRYIRITDIDEFGSLRSDTFKTANNIESKYILRNNDLLFARSGATAGKTFLYNEGCGKAIYAGYLIRFSMDETQVLPKFVYYYTQLQKYQNWVSFIQRSAGQPNINSEEFQSLEIPVLPIQIQNQVVALMDKAHQLKKEKGSEAEKLLGSIDDYVLSELGIKLPEVEKKKCFVVMSDEVRKKRIDSYHYNSEFADLERNLMSSKYKTVSFGSIIKKIINGFDFRKFSEDGKIYIKVGNVSKGGLRLEGAQRINVQDLFKDIKLDKGCLLLTRKGTFGIASAITDDLDHVISSEVFKIIPNNESTTAPFLEVILNSKIGQKQFDKAKIGAIMGSLSQDSVGEVLIPLPPIEIQNKIASEVKERMAKAQQLKEEAKSLLQKAKDEVEKMILGSGNEN